MHATRSNQPRRIIFLSSNLCWGGSEELWSQTAGFLAQEGHHVGVRVLYRDTSKGHLRRLSEQGCIIQEGWFAESLPSSHYDFKAAVMAWIKRVADSFRFRLFFWKFGIPDLVVVSQGGNHDGHHMAKNLRTGNFPYVLLAEKATEMYWPDDTNLFSIQMAYASALRCYFVSQHNLRLTEEQLGMRLPHGEVVRNPFNVSWNKRVEWPDDMEAFRLACIGRLEPTEKGQDMLLRVLAMDKWRARPLTVGFFGSGPQREGLARLAKMLNLTSVRLEGFIEDVESIWKKHHALILPSRCEGLPLVIVEAMLLGRPVIATRVAGNAEVVENGRTGFLAEAPTEAALDAALEAAWKRRHEWRTMGEAAAVSIRELVPPNPPKIFAQGLLALLTLPDSTNPRHRPL